MTNYKATALTEEKIIKLAKMVKENKIVLTKEQYIEMILDELDFQNINLATPKKNFIAYLSKAKKDRLIKFYEILCDECEIFQGWIKEQQIIKARFS